MIDLRSDTVTRPTEAMREAMRVAPVGDDQFGEDPTVNLLQERMAEVLGTEATLWVPTGTMANQIALRTLTSPGDDVIVASGSHLVSSETGAAAANSGVQFTQLGDEVGFYDSDELAAAIKPRGHVVLPPTTLVALENTHNSAGGVVVPPEILAGVAGLARESGIASYLDGARLWNAAAATGSTVADLATGFDLVWVAFSKGLGAPGGSILGADNATVARAHRYRRMFGGAMRQVGILAAAALHALDHHRDDLLADHANARAIAEVLAASDAIELDPTAVRTNIVIFGLAEGGNEAETVVARAADRGVGVFAFGRGVRAVTHRDVSASECLDAARILVEAAEA